MYTIKERATGKAFAGKAIDRAKIKGKEGDVKSEIEIMSKLEHPNLARVYESFEGSKEIWLVMDLAEGGLASERAIANERRRAR